MRILEKRTRASRMFSAAMYANNVGERLAERLPEAWEALRFSDERAWRKAGHDLRVEARRAKEALSSTAEYTIYLGAPIDAEIVCEPA